MNARIMQPFAVALLLGNGELDLRIYEAETKEEALGLAMLDTQVQGKMNDRKTYIADFKVMPANENALESIAIAELKAGRKIGAIREVRNYTGWGVKEARLFVDDVIEKHPDVYVTSH